MVAQVNAAFLEEDDLIYFLQLVADDFMGQCHSWLQLLEHLKHELLVKVVLPRVEIKPKGESHFVLVLEERKKPSEDLQEVGEHEFGVNLGDHLAWQLVQNFLVLLISERVVGVMAPFVLEECLDIMLELLVDGIPLI